MQVAGRPETYRIAGGAPLFVSSWESVGGGPQAVQTLSQTQFNSLPDRPATGTFLQSGSTGRTWRVVKGVATFVPSWAPYGGPQPSIVVDQAALDNAGTGGVWNLLTSGRPAPRTTGPTIAGTTAREDEVQLVRRLLLECRVHLDVRWRKARWDGTLRPVGPSRVLAAHRGLRRAAGHASRLRLLRVGARPQPGRPALRLDRRAAARPAP